MTRNLRAYLEHQRERLQATELCVPLERAIIVAETYAKVLQEIEEGARSAKSIAKHARKAMTC